MTFSVSTWQAIMYLAIVAGVFIFALFQYGAARGPSIVTGGTLYLSVLSGTLGGTLILGERLTLQIILGAVLLLFGVFLTTTLPLLKRSSRS